VSLPFRSAAASIPGLWLSPLCRGHTVRDSHNPSVGAMSESRFEKIQTIATILSLAIGGALGIVGWRYGGENVGYYLGTFLATQGLLAVALYLGNYGTLMGTLPKLVGGKNINLMPGAGIQSLLSNLKGGDSLIILPTVLDVPDAKVMAHL